jgi:hypothetical protein
MPPEQAPHELMTDEALFRAFGPPSDDEENEGDKAEEEEEEGQ